MKLFIQIFPTDVQISLNDLKLSDFTTERDFGIILLRELNLSLCWHADSS